MIENVFWGAMFVMIAVVVVAWAAVIVMNLIHNRRVERDNTRFNESISDDDDDDDDGWRHGLFEDDDDAWDYPDEKGGDDENADEKPPTP